MSLVRKLKLGDFSESTHRFDGPPVQGAQPDLAGDRPIPVGAPDTSCKALGQAVDR